MNPITMTSVLRTLTAGLTCSAVLLLAACGGGGGGGGDAVITPPTAVVKPSQASVPIGTAVTLDGTGSTTPNGGTLSYAWTLTTKPDGSAAVLSDATGSKPSFTPDKPGDYVVDLVVKDAKVGSPVVRVTIPATNPDPVAVITPATQSVLQGSTVSLNGATSLPPTGAAAADLRYEWKFSAQPDGLPATVLVDAASAKPSFTASKLGVYKLALVVRHGERVSVAATAEVVVNNGNSRPVAKLVAPKTAVRGSAIVLDGSGSTDADGDTLHYRWAFAPFVANSTNTPVPAGSKATITNATSAKAELVPDAVGKYYVDFTVYDNSVSATERVIIDVTKPAGAVNSAPVAMIGRGLPSEECEVGGYCGQNSIYAYDLDGDALTGKWTYWNTATPDDKKTESGRDLYALSYLSAAGTWQVQLVVNDGQTDSAPATQTVVLKTGANTAPFAKATINSGTVLVGETLTFDASGSTDRNGDQLSVEWTLIDRPDGSAATLQTPTAVRSSVVTDKPGMYRARLRVFDPKGLTRVLGSENFVQAFAKAQNNAPVVANLRMGSFDVSDTTQPLVLYPFTANGATVQGVSARAMASIFDPDLDSPLYYILTATRYPVGSGIVKSLAGQTTSGVDGPVTGANGMGAISPDLPGEYELQLVASDGAAYSQTKTLNFRVVTRANYPGLLLEESTWQLPWPLNVQSMAALTDAPDGNARVIGTYTLYAGDQDYTVADLAALAKDGVAKPAFIGLQNGQVIRKGQSVTFQVVRPALPDEQAQVKALMALANQQAAFAAESKRLQKLVFDNQYSWSFRVAEKPARTFRVEIFPG